MGMNIIQRALRRRVQQRSAAAAAMKIEDEVFLENAGRIFLQRFMEGGFMDIATKERRRAREILAQLCENLAAEERRGLAEILVAQFQNLAMLRRLTKQSVRRDIEAIASGRAEGDESIPEKLTECMAEALKEDGGDFLYALCREMTTKQNSAWLGYLSTKAFAHQVGGAEVEVGQAQGQSAIENRLDDMADALGLTDLERELVLALYVMRVIAELPGLRAFDDIYCQEIFRTRAQVFLGCARGDLTTILQNDGTLRRCGILGAKRFESRLEIDDELSEFLAGYKGEKFLAAVLQRVDVEDASLDDVSIPREQVGLLLDVLRQRDSAQVVVYGLPGHGKTTLVRAAAKAVGRELYQIRGRVEEDPSVWRSSLQLAGTLLRGNPGAILMVDEADRVLCTETSWVRYGQAGDKAWLNDLLDHTDVCTIWVTNDIRGISTSSQRRFDLAMRFGPLNSKQRFEVWKKILARHPEAFSGADDDVIWDLASRYPLAPSTVKTTAEKVVAMMKSCGGDSGASAGFAANGPGTQKSDGAVVLFKKLLDSAMDLARMTAGNGGALIFRPVANYSLDGLNLDADPVRMIESVRNVYDFIEANPDERRPTNLNILLMGPPGTGKTELVKYIGATTGRDVIVKRASDLLSAWVGGTEKLIAAAFNDAQMAKAILFIDEADSLFLDRQSASRSWETSQTNELLQQMEQFKGVLICATNNERNFDGAAFRRFSIKASFGYLRDDAKVCFFRRFFPGLAVTPAVEESLRRMAYLAPGDYHAVASRFRFQPGGVPGVDEVLKALESEVHFKALKLGRTIGYGR